MKTPAQRKQDERDRMRAAGFVLKQAWVHRDDWARVVKYLNAVSARRNRIDGGKYVDAD